VEPCAIPEPFVTDVARAGADAELLELGCQFEAAWAEFEAIGERFDVAVEPVYTAVAAQATWPEDQDEWSHADGRAYWKAYKAAWEKFGAEADTIWQAQMAAGERVDRVAEKINRLQCTTHAGLCVKARVAMWTDEDEPPAFRSMN
jgi:hypothetical protein